VLVMRGRTSIGVAGSQQARLYKMGGYRTVTTPQSAPGLEIVL
jgi:hypothetical protein